MEINLIYSRKDPQQTKARDFIRKFVEDRGVLAQISENDQPVNSPTVIIDGHAIKEKRSKPRKAQSSMYPSVSDIAHALEEHIWCL